MRSLIDSAEEGSALERTTADPAADLVIEVEQAIDRVLRPLLAGVDRVALLDFPNYSNVGDSAIWLGELAYLRRSGMPRVVYTCDMQHYNARAMLNRLGGGMILLSGGGNFGDVWPAHQRFRERVLHDFPNHRVIQLPQTIHFSSREALDASRRSVNRHEHLTLLVRDEPSLSIAHEGFHTPVRLCPDMAFCLGTLSRRVSAQADIYWLARTDVEQRAGSAASAQPGVEVGDWLEEPISITKRVERWLQENMRNRPRKLAGLHGPLGYVRERLASERLERGLRQLSRGRVVITDRLHGHILSTLMGIPHVLLDNSYGKVFGFHRLWTGESPLVHPCDSSSDALLVAREISSRSCLEPDQPGRGGVREKEGLTCASR